MPSRRWIVVCAIVALFVSPAVYASDSDGPDAWLDTIQDFLQDLVDRAVDLVTSNGPPADPPQPAPGPPSGDGGTAETQDGGGGTGCEGGPFGDPNGC